MKNILIIRHAESLANAGERTSAHDTIPLSEKGKMQALDLAQQLDIIPDLIVLSPFTRTHETAAPFISKHKSVPVEIWNVQEFTYLDTKVYNGTTMDERMEAAKTYWGLTDIHLQNGEEAESFYVLIKRIEDFVNKLKVRQEKNIVIFSHGGFIQNLKTYLEIIGVNKGKEILEEDVLELMRSYKGILGKKFPIENVSVHKLDI